MPPNYGVRFNDDQALSPTGQPAVGEDPEAAMCIPELWSALVSLENNELLPKAEVLGDKTRSGLENGGESIGKAANHREVP
jgi:hypothetical protein